MEHDHGGIELIVGVDPKIPPLGNVNAIVDAAAAAAASAGSRP